MDIVSPKQILVIYLVCLGGIISISHTPWFSYECLLFLFCHIQPSAYGFCILITFSYFYLLLVIFMV